MSVFRVAGDRLELRQVVSSGGRFPVSVAVHGNHAYVLNALDGGARYGYRIGDGQLSPIPSSRRGLGLDPAATPQFTSTPGQVAFTPDGSAVLVTTKANGNDVDVYAVRSGGLLSASPVVNPEPGAVPFAISFDRDGHVLRSALLRLQRGSGSVSGYTTGGFLYVQTGAAGIVDEFAIDASGGLSPIGSVTVAGAVGGEGIAAV